jgi:hypothetical protein
VNHKILYLFASADHHEKFFALLERGQWLKLPRSSLLLWLFKYFPNEAVVVVSLQVSQSAG